MDDLSERKTNLIWEPLVCGNGWLSSCTEILNHFELENLIVTLKTSKQHRPPEAGCCLMGAWHLRKSVKATATLSEEYREPSGSVGATSSFTQLHMENIKKEVGCC